MCDANNEDSSDMMPIYQIPEETAAAFNDTSSNWF